MPNVAQHEAAQAWPYWLLRYVATSEPQALMDVMTSVTASPPYGSVSVEEASAVDNLLQEYMGQGQASAECYEALTRFTSSDQQKLLALEIFRIHDAIASSPDDFPESSVELGSSLAHELQHEGAIVYFDLLRAQLCQTRGDIEDAYKLTFAGFNQLLRLALKDQIYAKRSGDITGNVVVMAVLNGEFEIVRKTIESADAMGVAMQLDDIRQSIGPRPEFLSDATAISSHASELLESNREYEALEWFVEAENRLTQAGNEQRLSGMLGDMAVAFNRVGNSQRAVRVYAKAIELCRKYHEDRNLSAWASNLGNLYLIRGDDAKAEEYFAEAQTAAVRSGDAQRVAVAADNLGRLLASKGRYAEAVESLRRAGDAARGNGFLTKVVGDNVLAIACDWVATLMQEGRTDQACQVIEDALGEYGSAENATLRTRLLFQLAVLREKKGDPAGAAQTIDQATELAREAGDLDLIETLEKARDELSRGGLKIISESSTPLEGFYKAIENAVRERDVEAEATARVNLVANLIAEHDARAVDALEEALSLVRSMSDSRRELILLLNGTDLMLERGEGGRAHTMAQRALELSKTSSTDYQILAYLYQARVLLEGVKDNDLALASYRGALDIHRKQPTAVASLSDAVRNRLQHDFAIAARLALEQGDTNLAIEFIGVFQPEKAQQFSQRSKPKARELPSIEELRQVRDAECERVMSLWSKTPAPDGTRPEGILEQMRSMAEQLNWQEVAQRLERVNPDVDQPAEPTLSDASAFLELIRQSLKTGTDYNSAFKIAKEMVVTDDEFVGLSLYAVSSPQVTQSGIAGHLFHLASRLAVDPKVAAQLARLAGIVLQRARPADALEHFSYAEQCLKGGEDDALRAALQNEAALCLQEVGQTTKALQMAQSALTIAERIGARETAAIAEANIGSFFMQSQEYAAAIPILEQALPRAEAVNNEGLADVIRHNLRSCLQALGGPLPEDLPLDESDPDALVNEAVTVALAGDAATGVELFDRAFRVAGEAQTPWSSEGTARSQFARTLYDARQYDRAVEQMKKAAKLLEERGNARELFSAYSWLAAQKQSVDAAKTYAQKALELARKLDDPELIAEGLTTISQTTANPVEAVRLLREATEFAPENLKVKIGLAEKLELVGDSIEARDIYQSILDAGDDVETEIVVAALLGHGQNEIVRGAVTSGLTSLQKAHQITAAANLGVLAIETCNRLGNALMNAGRLFEAVDVIEEGLERAHRSGLSEEHILLAYGNVLKLLGSTDAAQKAFERSRDLARSSTNVALEARAVHSLAGLELDFSRYDKARVLYLEAANLANRVSDNLVEAAALDSAGLTYTAQGRPARAIEYHLRAADIHEKFGAHRSACIDLLNLAQAFVLVKEAANTEKALERYRKNLTTADANATGDLSANEIEAQLLALKADWPGAHAAFTKAIADVESRRLEFRNPGEARQWAERTAQTYRIAALTAAKANQPEAAIEFLECNRVRFVESVRMRRSARPASVDDDNWKEYLRAEDAFVKARAVQRTRLAIGEAGLDENTERARQNLRRAQAAIEIDTTTQVPRKPAVMRSLSDLTAPLEGGESAVWVELIGDQLLLAIAACDADGKITARATVDEGLSPTDLHGWVFGDFDALREGRPDQLEALYSNHLGLTALSLKELPERILRAITSRVCDDIGARLWPRLLAVLPEETKKLILIPSAGFNVLPLHASKLSNGTFADERFEIRYAPSLKTLGEVLTRTTSDAFEWQLGQAINPTEDSNLAFTIAEAETVAGVFENRSIRKLPGRKAKPERVLELLKKSETVHFSGHSFYDAKLPEQSGLLCAISGKTPTVLTLGMILDEIDVIRARLVVLSGCESGLVQADDRLNDFLGLSAGLLAAGANSVVASLWRVDDLATAMLLTRFFKNWGNDGSSIPAALTEAQQWMRSRLTVGDTIRQLDEWLTIPFVDADALTSRLEDLRSCPNQNELLFENPIFWAGFCVSGSATI